MDISARAKPVIPWPLGLIPASAWGQAGRTGIPPEVWAEVRRSVHMRSGHACEAPGCGARGRLDAHEWYEWDDAKGIQRLGRIASACPVHHSCVHLGRTRTLSGSDRAAREALAELAKANHLTIPQAASYSRYELELCAQRSKRQWTLDISTLAEFGINVPHSAATKGSGLLRRLLGAA